MSSPRIQLLRKPTRLSSLIFLLITPHKKARQEQEQQELEREQKMQETMLAIKKKFGKNAILKGMNLEDGATAKERNQQIGGHKA